MRQFDKEQKMIEFLNNLIDEKGIEGAKKDVLDIFYDKEVKNDSKNIKAIISLEKILISNYEACVNAKGYTIWSKAKPENTVSKHLIVDDKLENVEDILNGAMNYYCESRNGKVVKTASSKEVEEYYDSIYKREIITPINISIKKSINFKQFCFALGISAVMVISALGIVKAKNTVYASPVEVVSEDVFSKPLDIEVKSDEAYKTDPTHPLYEDPRFIDENIYDVGDKIYDCNLSSELQHYLFDLCQTDSISFNVMMAILHRESGGQFNNSGVVVNNYNDAGEVVSYDVGPAQINSFNFPYLYKEFGYTEDEIINDDKKNIRCSVKIVSNIIETLTLQHKNEEGYEITIEEIAGMYNGWLEWQEKLASLEYSEAIPEIITANYYKNDFKITNDARVAARNIEGKQY